MAHRSSEAREAEIRGDFTLAAALYARAGKYDEAARVLEHAGEVSALENLLREEQARAREARALRHGHDEFAWLVASGRRVEAATLARTSDDPALASLGLELQARRISGRAVHAAVQQRSVILLLGDRVIVGRAPVETEADVANLVVPSEAISRRHVLLTRDGSAVVARDLGSRNGTERSGRRLTGDVPVGTKGLELRLGREVALVARPTSGPPPGTAIEVAGRLYVAPLGPAWLGIGRWRLERGPDEWVELVTDDDPPAFANGLRLAPRVALLRGDALSPSSGGPTELALDA